ncbi:MAG: CHAT domain-containing protein [Candidatus Hydrogenedentota bacterium]|nr:MAG: CHAT domain-containing protein [Candidatus Hydrogenedentota bacterium]
MDEKLKALLKMWQLQTEAADLFIQAEAAKASGDYETARPIYDDYIAKSKAYLQAALDFNNQFPESPYDIVPIAQPLVNAMMVQADVVQAIGDREAAKVLRKEAIEISRAHLDRTGSADTERSLAGALTLEGRFNEAIVALLRARDVFMEQNDQLTVARVTIDLADILQWLGDYRRAKEEIEHAQMIVEPVLEGKQPTQSDVLSGLMSSISSIMSDQGDSGEAMRATQLYRAATEVTYYHGLISRALEEWDEAERCMNEVLPEYQKLGSGEAIEYQLAQIKIGRGQVREGLEQSRLIEHQFYQGAFRPKLGVLQRLQAECLHALGQTAEARRLVEESIADLTEVYFDPDALWRSQWLRAQIGVGECDTEQAVGYFQDAIETINLLRRAPLGYRLDSTFLENKKEIYSEAIQRTLAAEAVLDCCRFMESLKSRTLTAVLSVPKSGAAVDSDLESQLDETTRQLDAMEYQGYREGWSRDRRLTHRDLLQKRADLLERIRISDPRWRTFTEPVQVDFNELLELLSRRSQAALMLHCEPPDLNAVLLFDGQAKGEQMRIPEQTLESLADYAKNFQNSNYDPFKHDFSVEYGVAASDLIPSSLLREAVKAESLVVIPHGQLHLLPWGGLVHENRRLFEQLPVGILPNLSILSAVSGPITPQQVALVGVPSYQGMDAVGDLPSARKEIEDIVSVYQAADIEILNPLLDEAATEAAFWKLADSISGDGNVLHMSCHGTIVPNEPMNSGMLLFDSKVDAAEVARARLPFDEVVLSACSTGWRPTQVKDVVLTADEILGIPAGFLESGASAVLVSIPKAEGQAARALTTHYHERRVAGDSPLCAFKSAQEHLLKQGVAAGAWVGFTLYGCI